MKRLSESSTDMEVDNADYIGYQVSKFVSRYFRRVFTSLRSYKSNNIEQALIETFLMLDNLLTLSSINKILVSYSLKGVKEEIDFDFLKFEHVNTDSILYYRPISFFYQQASYCENSHINLSEELTLLPEFCEEKKYYLNKHSLLNENANSGIDTDIDFIDEISQEIYSFGGMLVDNATPINSSFLSFSMGTTANVVVIRNKTCYIANAGDSMSVLYQRGKAVRLNLEHKPTLRKERERIIKSGTEVINNRISGRLNLSRAIGTIYCLILGDHQFKTKSHLKAHEQAVISLPEIFKFHITRDMEFLVMGCDGIWDCLDPQDLCEYISNQIKEKVILTKILKKIFGLILSKRPDGI